MTQDKRTYYFELVDVVKFLIKYKKPLSIISIGAGIAAIIFSGPWFITPLYKSTAIFYPSTNNLFLVNQLHLLFLLLNSKQ